MKPDLWTMGHGVLPPSNHGNPFGCFAPTNANKHSQMNGSVDKPIGERKKAY